VTGPSNAGKTRLTARALEAWIDAVGPDGVVALDFAPEFEREGTLLGGRLTRFTAIPGGVWYRAIEARAPRAAGGSAAETRRLASANAARSERVLAAAPSSPRAVFVNDATIPFQSGDLPVSTLTDYCDRAEAAVLNAFESEELGFDDPASRAERSALAELDEWADRHVRLRSDS
jgi:hypothetical protein